MTDGIPRKVQRTAGWPRIASQHRACVVCGASYAAHLSTRRYCSPRCRKRVWRARGPKP